MSVEHYDAIVIGAGISGLSAAYHLHTYCPDKTYKVLERRDNIGGTWDLFNYPGIRSDSDMYTFGYAFKPWSDKAAIARKEKILEYLEETADEYDIRPHIEFGLLSQRCEWDSDSATWTITTSATDGSGERVFTCQYVFMCVGYYNYDTGYTPEFVGRDDFNGEILHPQFWPEDTNYDDKNVVIIGSGATAITMLPSMADKAKHVTMLQRSPTYMGSKPAEDKIANWLGKWVGHWAARWWFILTSMFLYAYCKAFPERAKKAIVGEIETLLGDKFDAKHFTPDYNPWDQRVCLCPDADFFEAMKQGKASIVTNHIDRFTQSGIQLKSGEHLAADMIVTATGLDMLFLGGMEIVVDGKTSNPNEVFIYKGFMCNDTPNMFAAVGYTNASWTLKVDLTNRYACRLINYNDQKGHRICVPRASDDIQEAPLLDLDSGYIKRAEHRFPKQGSKAPWKLYQNYIFDKFTLKYSPVSDGSMEFL